MKTKKIVSNIKGIYYKKEEWIIDDNPHSFGCNYHREDGPALTYYYKDGTIAAERWYNDGELTRPIEDGPADTEYYKNGNIKSMYWIDRDEHDSPTKRIEYYENGNIKSELKGEYENPLYYRYTEVKYYEDGTIKEKYDSGTFEKYDSKRDMYMSDSYAAKYYENGNIKYEKLGINENCSLDKPVIIEYDINGNILKAKHFLYDIGKYITQTQLNKYNKQLQSKRQIKTLVPNKLEILYYLAKKYNYKDKIKQIEGLLVMSELIK